MQLRKFVPSDLDAILTLFHDVVHAVGIHYYSQEQVEAWAPSHLDTQKWLESLSANITYVAIDQDKIVGFADMTKSGYIDRLYVHKNYQGKGVSTRLLKRLEDEARNIKLSELTLNASIMAKPIAERYGFKIIREEKREKHGQTFVTFLMRKQL